MVRLSTIGPLSVYVGGKRVAAANKQVVAALFYLTVERGKIIPRRTLVDMFFPDATDEAGWHSQRQLIYRIRQRGADVASDQSTVTLPAAAVAWDFEELLTRGTATPEEIEALRYGYLNEYQPDLSEQFTHWLEEHREQVIGKLRHILVRQMRAARALHRFRDLEAVARACLALDPLNEEATLAAAEALAMVGAKTDALNLLDTYLAEVGEVEGAQSAALRAAPRLLRKRVSEQADAFGRERTALVGRQRELATVLAALAQSVEKTARACIVSGPSGIGKTRLLSESCAMAAIAGHRIARARLHSHDPGRPFAILRDLGGAVLDLPGSLGASPEALAGLRGLCGRGPLQYRDLPQGDLESQAVVAQVHAHVLEVIDAVAEEQPLVLYIEDAHWIDAASLDLLASLLSDRRCLCVLIATQRPLELPRGLSSNPNVEHVALPALTAQESEQVLRDLFASANRKPDGAFLESAVRTGGGSPFYLQVLFQHFQTTNDTTSLPPTLAESLAARLDQLDDLARSVFDAIVILGAESTERRLELVTQLPRYELAKTLRVLDGLGLIRATAEVVVPSHEYFANAAVSRIPGSVARLLHRAAAEVLEQEGEMVVEPLAIAAHWEGCGEYQMAVNVLRSSAEAYLHVGRPREAIEGLSKANQLAQSAESRDDIDRRLLVACRSAAEDRLGTEVAERLGLYQGRGSPEEQIIAAEFTYGTEQHLTPRIQRMEQLAASHAVNPHSRANAARLLIVRAADTGDHDMADRAMGAVADLSANNVDFLNAQLVYETEFGSALAAIGIIDRLDKAAEMLPVGTERLRHTWTAAIASFKCGSVERARAFAKTTYELAFTAKAWQLCLRASSFLSHIAWSYGDTEEGQRWFDIECDIVRSYSIDPGLYHRTSLVNAAIRDRQFDRARAGLAEIAALFPRTREERPRLEFLAIEIEVDLTAGVLPANEKLEELLVGHLAMRSTCSQDFVTNVLIGALRAWGRHEEARELREDYLTKYRRDLVPLPVTATYLLDS